MFFVFFVVFEIIQLSFFFYKSSYDKTFIPTPTTCYNSSNSINSVNSINSINCNNHVNYCPPPVIITEKTSNNPTSKREPSTCSRNGFWDDKRERCVCDMYFIGDECQISASYKAKEDINRENSFTHFYKSNSWGNPESKSGDGSTVAWTAALRKFLVNITEKYLLKSMLDMPCGDFNWMKLVEYPADFEYVGADVVKEEINVNREKYTTPNRHFVHRDMVIYPPYKSFDVIFSRDALQHLGTADVEQSIKNWEASGAKYLITTFYTELPDNHDIVPGDYRNINLLYPPYNFEDPLDSVVDMPPFKVPNSQKNMGIWQLPIKKRTVPKQI